MWILRWVVLAVFIILVIGFAMQNTHEAVSVRFLTYQSIDLPLWVIMYVAFAIGLFFWLIVSIFQILSLKNQLRKKAREIKRLRAELDKLRNVAVEDSVIPDTTDVSQESSETSGKE